MSKEAAPSKEAQEKAEHLKRNIEKIMGNKMKSARDRKKRDAALRLKLKDKNLNEKEKNVIKCNYILQESSFLRDQRQTKNKITADDFQIIKVIGKGAFGEVRIVRDIKTKNVYAMKTMVKELMEEKNQMTHIVAERDLMVEADCPWLVKLWYSFQDAKYLYLVMEYCGGGDLMGLLIKKDILPERDTRFYMSELAAAINAVHLLGFVHRDLKPDNVLIATNGHVRLSDFGLAKSFKSSNDKQLDNWQKFVQTIKPGDLDKAKDEEEKQPQKKKKGDRKQLYSTVGTPDYIAIEVLYQKGYDKKVDWWSLGVIMYECVVGFAPFHASEPLATCRKIVRYERYFKFTKDMHLTKNAVDLMKSLVCPKHRRLDYKAIREHPWFKDINWANLDKMKPPFVPELKNDTDWSNFDEIESDQKIDAQIKHSSYAKTQIGGGKDNRLFGYTYSAAQIEAAKEMGLKTEAAKQQLLDAANSKLATAKQNAKNKKK